MSQHSDPQNKYCSPVLGEMRYCPQDDTWVGLYNGFEYRIACDEGVNCTQPDSVLIDFCVDSLADKQQIQTMMLRQKQRCLGSFGGCFDDEIERLRIVGLTFYRYFDDLRILLQLGVSCDDEERLWRIEYHNGRWLTLEFDY